MPKSLYNTWLYCGKITDTKLSRTFETWGYEIPGLGVNQLVIIESIEKTKKEPGLPELKINNMEANTVFIPGATLYDDATGLYKLVPENRISMPTWLKKYL